MKKFKYTMMFVLTFFLFATNYYAINDIRVNNQSLSPIFSKDVYVYNFFVSNTNEINIVCNKEDSEIVENEGKYTLENNETIIKLISSIDNKTYTINIYKESEEKELVMPLLKTLEIKGYEINFDSNIFVYDVYINDELKLDIDYSLYSSSLNVLYTGNDNLTKSKNVIKFIISTPDDKTSNTYTINVYKTINTFKENDISSNINVNKTLLVIGIILIDIFVILFMIYIFYYKRFKYHI